MDPTPIPTFARKRRPRVPALLVLLLLGAAPATADPAQDASLPATSLPAAELHQKLASYLDAAAAEGFTGAVVVARGGEVLLEAGYGRIDPDEDRPVTPDTVFPVGSITKQFTAAAVLKLEEMGKLSVSDPITQWFDGVPEDKRGITVHHLLTHQAGFPGAIGDDFERVGRDEYVRRALATPLDFTPGTAYQYSNVGYSLAAAIVEKASGEPYERFLHDHLFAPAGMKDTGYHLPHWDPARLAHGVTDDGGDWGTLVGHAFTDGGPGWHLVGNGGIHSTVGDMLRWHRALTGDGILSAASKAKMYAKHVEEGGGTWYGYGWSIEPTPWGEAITHNGGNPYYFSDFLRFPAADVVVYYSTTSRDRRMHRLARPLAKIVFTGEVPELEAPRAALVAPGEAGPAAPEGTAAARWGLPGTPVGLRAGEFLAAIVSSDPAQRRAFVEAAFAPEVIERRGVDGLMEVLGRMAEDVGEFEVRGLRPGGDARLGVALERAGRPEPMEITVEVEPDAPYRIVGIGVEIGG